MIYNELIKFFKGIITNKTSQGYHSNHHNSIAIITEPTALHNFQSLGGGIIF